MRAHLGPKTDNIYMVRSGSLQMVLESILDPDVGSVWPYEEWLSVWPCNAVGHNEDVVSTWEGDCDIPHWIEEKVSDII